MGIMEMFTVQNPSGTVTETMEVHTVRILRGTVMLRILRLLLIRTVIFLVI